MRSPPTVAEFGRLTTLVNNAISDDSGSGNDSHVDVMDNETFDNIMQISLKGTFWASKYAIPEMRKAGTGSIVNISASSSKQSLPHRPAYQASKGAINALTRQMAVDYGKENIRCNAIIVGFIFTGTPEMTAILADDNLRAAFEKNVVVPYLGEPADIAAGVVYLASDESKYVTGTQLTIDGGALCRQPLPELDFDALKARDVPGAVTDAPPRTRPEAAARRRSTASECSTCRRWSRARSAVACSPTSGPTW